MFQPNACGQLSSWPIPEPEPNQERSPVMTTLSHRQTRPYANRWPVPTAPIGLIPAQRAAVEADLIEQLWMQFKTEGSAQAREKLIVHYLPLVSAVAGRLGMRLPSSVEHSDLVSYGALGLIDAVEKYELDRAVRFEAYASARIRGAILDELRSLDWVPRSVRTKARALDQAWAQMENKLRRTPTRQEVAEHLDISVTDLAELMGQIALGSLTALDAVLLNDDADGGVSARDRIADEHATDPQGEVDEQATSTILCEAIENLADRERLVVVLYYYERQTLAEIGRVLGVTESRVSQMHTAAVSRLRNAMAEAEAL